MSKLQRSSLLHKNVSFIILKEIIGFLMLKTALFLYSLFLIPHFFYSTLTELRFYATHFWWEHLFCLQQIHWISERRGPHAHGISFLKLQFNFSPLQPSIVDINISAKIPSSENQAWRGVVLKHRLHQRCGPFTHFLSIVWRKVLAQKIC